MIETKTSKTSKQTKYSIQLD